jgi:hypothetical protein
MIPGVSPRAMGVNYNRVHLRDTKAAEMTHLRYGFAFPSRQTSLNRNWR